MSTHLNVQVLTLVVGMVIPLLTALVTKEMAPKWLKAVINAFLAAAAAAIVVAIGDGGNVMLATWVIGIAEAWGASVVSYLGLMKPTGITDLISRKTRKVGFGRSPALPMDLASRVKRHRESGLGEKMREVHQGLRDLHPSGIIMDDSAHKLVPSPKSSMGIYQTLTTTEETVPIVISYPDGATPMKPWLISEAHRLVDEFEKVFREINIVNGIMQWPTDGSTPLAPWLLAEANAVLENIDREVQNVQNFADVELGKVRYELGTAVVKFEDFMKGIS